MIKLAIMMPRNPKLTCEEFIEYHKTKHAALFMSLPESKKYVKRYVQSHKLPGEIPGVPPAKFDGITELWFENEKDFAALFTSKEYLEKIRPDEMKFIDLEKCELLLTTENVVL